VRVDRTTSRRQAFFVRPGREGFAGLVEAAKARCQEPVRRLARAFLETGDSPIRVVAASKGRERRVQVAADWPLPMPEYLTPFLLDAQASAVPRRRDRLTTC
jgi:hypothetical protein